MYAYDLTTSLPQISNSSYRNPLEENNHTYMSYIPKYMYPYSIRLLKQGAITIGSIISLVCLISYIRYLGKRSSRKRERLENLEANRPPPPATTIANVHPNDTPPAYSADEQPLASLPPAYISLGLSDQHDLEEYLKAMKEELDVSGDKVMKADQAIN